MKTAGTDCVRFNLIEKPADGYGRRLEAKRVKVESEVFFYNDLQRSKRRAHTSVVNINCDWRWPELYFVAPVTTLLVTS